MSKFNGQHFFFLVVPEVMVFCVISGVLDLRKYGKSGEVETGT